MTATNPPGAGASLPADSASRDEPQETLALFEEKAVVEKDEVTTGRVRVTTRTTVAEELASATVQGEAVEVTRVPIGTPVTGEAPSVRTDGDVTIIPVFEEVLVVEKQLMLKEEIHIRRRATIERVELPVELRQQHATVERTE